MVEMKERNGDENMEDIKERIEEMNIDRERVMNEK